MRSGKRRDRDRDRTNMARTEEKKMEERNRAENTIIVIYVVQRGENKVPSTVQE